MIALDLLEFKLNVAKACGADIVLNPSECNVVEKIRELSDGYGCDVYIEATGMHAACAVVLSFVLISSFDNFFFENIKGAPQSVVQGLHAIAKLGRFIEFSVFSKETTVDWTIIGDTKSLDIR